MPINILGTAFLEGTDKIPYFNDVMKFMPYLAFFGSIKYWSRGSTNTWERNLHGKVYIITGATTQGMGTSVVLDMARRGAQLIILTRTVDEWYSDWCEDLRNNTHNSLIYLEKCDLSDLYEIRKFATKWLNNSPPRRLDGVIIMSGDTQPWGLPWISKKRNSSKDGLELQIATNFVGIFHLLNLLQPSFTVQPPDRDVRIIVVTCFLQALGKVNLKDPLWINAKFDSPLKFFSSSKLQLSLCMLELQRRIIVKSLKNNKDGRSGKNVKVILVNPGLMRSISLRRVISNGSVISLVLIYCLLLYPILWLLTKNGYRGAQSVLYSIMTPEFEESNQKNTQVRYVSNCSIVNYSRKEFRNEDLHKILFDKTEKDITILEKKMALKRARTTAK